MTKHVWAGASAIGLVVGLSLSAAYANPTVKQNDYNVGSAIGNIANSVHVYLNQDASADGDAMASASWNGGSWANAAADGYGGYAGDNYATIDVQLEVGNVALISENELYMNVSNSGSVYAGTGGGCWHYKCWGGDAEAATGSASQNAYQQQWAAGTFNNALSTGIGSGQEQGNAAGINGTGANFLGMSN